MWCVWGVEIFALMVLIFGPNAAQLLLLFCLLAGFLLACLLVAVLLLFGEFFVGDGDVVVGVFVDCFCCWFVVCLPCFYPLLLPLSHCTHTHTHTHKHKL